MRNWNTTDRQNWIFSSLVLSLPMRNWNICGLICLAAYLSFSAYLWGIETRGSAFERSGVVGVLSLPMRNWNRSNMLFSISLFSVLSLPMRNWNQHLAADIHNQNSVLSLPMRNWNSWAPSDNSAVWPVLSLPMRNWNCKWFTICVKGIWVLSLPMRNWNPNTFWLILRDKRGSQPTYEELKLNHFSFVFHKRHVLSLPMRNWNFGFDKAIFFAPGFSAYLWGIETLPCPAAP